MKKRKAVSDQVIVITGASSGIGLATAKLAAKRGAKVVMASRNVQDLAEIARDLRRKGCEVFCLKCDVSKFLDVRNLKEKALDKYGHIDTWVNNAGTSIFGPILSVPLEDEKQLFETNFWGIRHGCHMAVEAMERRGGVIINLGSETSEYAVPYQGMYSATKQAIKAYTDALRVELEYEKVPISVCLIRPTAINTPFANHAENFIPDGEPSLPSPTYHPDVVARAILHCAEYPQRDVYVGASSRIFSLLGPIAPRMLDHLGRKVIDMEKRGTKIPHSEIHESLKHPPIKEGKVVGANRGLMHRTSFYTSAAQHPWRTAAFAGVVAAAAAIIRAGKRAA